MSSATAGKPGAVVFTGEPDALEAVVPISPRDRKKIEIGLDTFTDDRTLRPARVLTAPHTESSTIVRLILPTSTPPGNYRLQLRADAAVVEARVIIEATAHLTVRPGVVRVTCYRGVPTEFEVDLANEGNSSFVIGQRYAFGVLETNGVDAAIGKALRRRTEPKSRVDIFADDLAERRGGLARLRLPKLEPIPPGSNVRTTATILLHDTAVPDREYHGLWRFADARVPVYITMAPSDVIDTYSKEHL